MSAAPAHRRERSRSEPRPGPGRSSRSRDAAARRRRERHFRRRRRDLLQDMVIGLLLAIVLIAVTGGLGVLALAEVPIAGALVAMFVVERRLRRSRARPTRARRAR